MPWKEGYTITDEKTMDDGDVIWPDPNRCAVTVVVDYSVHAGSEGINPEDVNKHLAEFGRRVAMPRLFDLFEK